MPPEATLIENGTNRRPTLIRDAGVFTGTRHYKILGATSLADAFSATGLPAPGAPWDPSIERCKARRFEPVLEPGPIPVFFMKVGYREDSVTQYTAEPDLVITTTAEQSVSSETVDYDITGEKTLTNDGRGVPKILSALSFSVIQFFQELPDIGPYLDLSDEPKVNLNPVTFQNFMNSGQTLVVPEMQLLYTHFTLGYEQGLFTVRSHLQRRRHWENLRPLLNPDGTQRINQATDSGMFEAAKVYEEVDYGNLLG